MPYVLAQSSPAATTDTDLYTVPANTQTVVSTLTVCESANTGTRYRILIRPNGDAAAPEHNLIYDAAIAARDTHFITCGLTLTAGDVITIYTEDANLSFHMYGDEKEA